jgi:hypothetical protein
MYYIILRKTGRILKQASNYSDIAGKYAALENQGKRFASLFGIYRIGWTDIGEEPWVCLF